MLYEKTRETSQLSLQHWTSSEFLSFKWFLLLGILLISYALWFKLLDKSRATKLLLIGSLAAVFYHLNIIILIDLLGYVEYTVRLTPFTEPPFTSSTTLIPLTVMLVLQYTSSWKGYLLWSAIGLGFIGFGIFQIYILAGILQLHDFNLFYYFLALFGVSIVVRFVFLWITHTEKRQTINQS